MPMSSAITSTGAAVKTSIRRAGVVRLLHGNDDGDRGDDQRTADEDPRRDPLTKNECAEGDGDGGIDVGIGRDE